jgi:DNA-binding MarR family transcriptional regulator
MPRVGRALVTRTTWSFDGGTTPRPVAHLANLDLNLLVALRELLRARGMSRAAERLGVTQPAASAALSRLRRRHLATFNESGSLPHLSGREWH